METNYMPRIETFVGPFGCGKTTALKKEYYATGETNNLFFASDKLYQEMNRNLKIPVIPFSSIINLLGSCENKRRKRVFIDNADLFIDCFGICSFEKVLEYSAELYISYLSVKMQKCLLKYQKRNNYSLVEKRKTKISVNVAKYLDSLSNYPSFVRANIMHMSKNPGLPKDYIQQIKEIYGYEE